MTNKNIFVNLPVRDLPASIAFFTALGYEFNRQFTDETAACMVVSDTIYVMLLTHAKFQSFVPLPISDAKKATEVAVCLSFENRQTVDETLAKAIAAGGTTYSEPTDYGFMYFRAFQDLDGHIWEYLWMDPAAVKPS